jgi:peptide/nickel transport system permease protein
MADAARIESRSLAGSAGARGLWARVVHSARLMMRNKVGFAGFLGVIFFLVLAFVVPIFVPISTATVTGQIYAPPSWAHPLGTDYEGRDIWVQVIHGGADVMIVGFLTAAITTVIAVSLGALAAFVGGWFDEVMMGLTDIVLTIPQFPLLAVLATFLSLGNVVLVALLLSALGWPFLLRSVRAQVLSLKERDYVEAARGLDLSTRYILFREILPNMMAYIVISFMLATTGAIYAEVGLFFLGLVPLAGSNWGLMMNLAWIRGAVFYPPSIFYILGPVLAVVLFQLSLVFMTRSLEDVFNPRLAREG